MEYRAQPLAFKVRKILRYTRLYGPTRTLLKVQGNLHSTRTYDRLPTPNATGEASKVVGIIGCGNFAYTTIGYYLHKNYGSVTRGVMDINVNRAASFAMRFGADYYTTDVQQLLEDDGIDLVFVASNHASHAEYAIEALRRGKHVHIEKPHVVNRDQLERLASTMEASSGRVALGFNRPDSILGGKAHAALAAESGSAMMNWFVAGHEISPDHWYFAEAEGGRVLGNLCHWTDFVYRMVSPPNRYPLRISPARSVKSDCDIAVSYVFGDGTLAVITFSAKGHTFEGVRERFSAHRGDTLLSLDDFKVLTIDRNERRERHSLPFRDQGHENRITSSYGLLDDRGHSSCSTQYVWETADLFLATKQALEEQTEITLSGSDRRWSESSTGFTSGRRNRA